MAIDFPAAPALDQEYTDTNGTVWICTNATGPIWARKSTLAVSGDTVSYNNTGSSLASTDVNSAIDELDLNKANLDSPALTGNPTAPTPSVSDNDTSIATTAFVQNEIVSHAQIGKNLLINGDFSVWQRGDAVAVDNSYTADRWNVSSANIAYTASELLSLYKNDVSGYPDAIRVVTAGTDLGYFGIGQAIENGDQLVGREVTFSYEVYIPSGVTFYLDATVGIAYRADSLIIRDGTRVGEQLISSLPRDEYVKISHTFIMPACTSYVAVGPNFRALHITTNGLTIFYVRKAQLELGSESTDFEVVDPNSQLNRCGVPDDSSTFGYKPFYETIVNREQAGKNLLINGDFSVIRDSTSIATTLTGQYTLARWLGYAPGTTVSQQEFTHGQTDVEGSPVYYIRQVNPASVNWYIIRQRVEDLRRFSDRTITLSYWMKASTPFVNQVAIGRNFGTGGSAHDSVILPDVSVTTSWQKFTHTYTTPSLSGKTVGSGSSLEISILRAYQGTNTIEVANAQLEFGEQATEFEIVDYPTQLNRCGTPDDSSPLGYKLWQNFMQSGKNLLINGDFSVIRDSTSITTTLTGQYTLARWRGATSGTTVSQEEFTPGQTDVYGSPRYFYRHVCTSVDQWNEVIQKIEGLSKFSGQYITISYWMRANSAFTNWPFIARYYGTGGSTADGVQLDAQSVTTSWQRFVYVYLVPSISGKTLGSGNNLEIHILRSLMSNNTVEVANVQVEFGDQATDFEVVDPATQLARCQRYYQILDYAFTSGHYDTGYTRLRHALSFPVSMRQAPNVISHTLYYVQLHNSTTDDKANWTTFTTGSTTNKITLENYKAGSFTNAYHVGQITLDAEL